MTTKICNKCKEELPITNFSPSRKGHRSDCKTCHNGSSRQSVLKRKLATEKQQEALEFDPEQLAAEYGKNKLWVSRGLKACRLAGVTEKYFIDRYLKRDDKVLKNEEVESMFRWLRGAS